MPEVTTKATAASANRRTSYAVLSTSILARLQQGMAPLAVVLLVQQRTGSIAAAGWAAGAWSLAAAFGQPLWAKPAGQGRAELVIAATSVAQAAVLLTLALSSVTVTVGLVALAGLGGLLDPPTSPVARTLWPELANDQHELDALFTLDTTTQELIFIAGPAAVAILVTVEGPAAALTVAAAAGAMGGLLFAFTIRRLWTPHPRSHGSGHLGGGLVAPFVTLYLTALGLGHVEVGVPAAAILDGNRGASGWLLAVWSLGSLVGGVIASRILWRGRPADRLTGLLLGLAAGTGVVVLAWQAGLGWLGAGLFVAGLALAPTLAACHGVIGDVAELERRTDAFAWAITFILLGIGSGAALGGVLAEQSPTWAFTAAASAILVALVAWLTLRRDRSASVISTGPKTPKSD